MLLSYLAEYQLSGEVREYPVPIHGRMKCGVEAARNDGSEVLHKVVDFLGGNDKGPEVWGERLPQELPPFRRARPALRRTPSRPSDLTLHELHGIKGYGFRGHHCRYADGDHRHTQAFPGDPEALVTYTRPRPDARVAHLDGRAEPAR